MVECELCPGKLPGDLPDSCTGDPPFVCDGGAKRCIDVSECDVGYVCTFGCCIIAGPG